VSPEVTSPRVEWDHLLAAQWLVAHAQQLSGGEQQRVAVARAIAANRRAGARDCFGGMEKSIRTAHNRKGAKASGRRDAVSNPAGL
jgi:hypothetical protein